MQEVEGVSSVSMSQNHTCYKSMFCRESLQLESSFVFRQNTVALTSAREGNQTHAQTLGPKRAGAAERLKNTLMSSFWLWVPETGSHSPALEHPPGVGGRSAGALHSSQEPFLGFSSVLVFFLCLCLPHTHFLEQHPDFGHC